MSGNRRSSNATIVSPDNSNKCNIWIQQIKTKLQPPLSNIDEEQPSKELQTEKETKLSTFKKNSRRWIASLLMIVIGIIIVSIYVLVGLGKTIPASPTASSNTTTTVMATTVMTTPS